MSILEMLCRVRQHNNSNAADKCSGQMQVAGTELEIIYRRWFEPSGRLVFGEGTTKAIICQCLKLGWLDIVCNIWKYYCAQYQTLARIKRSLTKSQNRNPYLLRKP